MAYVFDANQEIKRLKSVFSGMSSGVLVLRYAVGTDAKTLSAQERILAEYGEENGLNPQEAARWADDVMKRTDGSVAPELIYEEVPHTSAAVSFVGMGGTEKDIKNKGDVITFMLQAMGIPKQERKGLGNSLSMMPGIGEHLDPEMFKFYAFWHEAAHMLCIRSGASGGSLETSNKVESYCDSMAIMMFRRTFPEANVNAFINMVVAMRLAGDMVHAQMADGHPDREYFHHTVLTVKATHEFLQNTKPEDLTAERMLAVADGISEQAQTGMDYYAEFAKRTPELLRDMVADRPRNGAQGLERVKEIIEHFDQGADATPSGQASPQAVMGAQVASAEAAMLTIRLMQAYAGKMGTAGTAVMQQLQGVQQKLLESLEKGQAQSPVSPRNIAQSVLRQVM